MRLLSQNTFPFALAVIITLSCAPTTIANAGETYELDPSHTHVVFSVQRFGFNDVIAFFPAVAGNISLDHDAPENSAVEVEIGVASIVSGDATRNEHLVGEFWFNVGEHPTITFKSTSVERTGEDTAEVTGDLTVLGVSKSVSLNVKLNKLGADPASKREAAGFSATATLNRHDFGMSIAENLIGGDVSIRIETLAHKAE
ncbi:MAG: YceI family protein [Marinicaulis sp.]|nr:YceI family protein [Marinicaulis sp.]NNL88291.1 YceI family protein [Marinicaulis sp.]